MKKLIGLHWEVFRKNVNDVSICTYFIMNKSL
jgi:hypothetical protein